MCRPAVRNSSAILWRRRPTVGTAPLPPLCDSRHWFLKPGGVLIPRRDRVWLAAVGLASPDYDRVAVWSNRDWGIDLSSATRFGVDRPFSARLELDRLRSTSAPVACIDH